jgi:hypothetical protein
MLPKVIAGEIYTFIFMMGMGTLICLAMILGRIFA